MVVTIFEDIFSLKASLKIFSHKKKKKQVSDNRRVFGRCPTRSGGSPLVGIVRYPSGRCRVRLTRQSLNRFINSTLNGRTTGSFIVIANITPITRSVTPSKRLIILAVCQYRLRLYTSIVQSRNSFRSFSILCRIFIEIRHLERFRYLSIRLIFACLNNRAEIW